MSWARSRKTLLVTAISVLGMGLLLALVDGTGRWLAGWLGYGVLLGMGAACMFGAAHLVGVWQTDGGAQAMRAAISAFLIRLIAGVVLTLLLPVAGYQDSEVTLAGYVFKDAYFRDRQAWKLANSDLPLGAAFTRQNAADQYGGMLALSALIYRTLSPDAHRQMLVLLLTAAVAACGVLFLWKATESWFGASIAGVTAWIFALFPESIFLGSSQMREAFVISGVAMAFCSFVLMQRGRRSWLAWLGLAFALLFLFHPPTALVTVVVLAGIWLFEPRRTVTTGRSEPAGRSRWIQLGVIVFVLVVGLLVVVSIWSRLPSLQKAGPLEVISTWLQNNFNYQSYKLERSSGWMQKLLTEAGEGWWPVIVISRGITQPMLPATLFEPSALIWMVTNSLRALGWYLLAPLLVYGLGLAIFVRTEARRAQLIWLGLFTWIWIILSSANAGGDMFDNPRYRVIFLAWQAMLAAWAWGWARSHRDVWLGRVVAVEAVFVLFFTEWYASRYTRLFSRLHFWEMVASILVIGAGIILGSWLWDRTRKRKEKAREL